MTSKENCKKEHTSFGLISQVRRKLNKNLYELLKE
jgi:hypothetical protein